MIKYDIIYYVAATFDDSISGGPTYPPAGFDSYILLELINLEPDFSILSELPEIKTERLTLRRISMDDADDLFECFGDSDVADNMMFRKIESIEAQRRKISEFLEDYEAGESARWCAEERSSGKVIGSILLFSVHNATRAAAGYFVNRAYWGRGFASEMLRAILDFGFMKIGLNRIEGEHFIENPASGIVMQKCGMRCEGESRDYYLIDGVQKTVRRYAVLRRDYKENAYELI